MKKLKCKLYFVLVSILILSLLAGCGQQGANQTTTLGTTSPAKDAPATEAELEPITFTTLTTPSLNTDPLTNGDPNKTPYNMEVQKRTKVTIERIITNDYDTKFNLLVASDELPDFFVVPASYPGGVAKAAADGLIITISDYWDKYCPNLKAMAESKPEWSKELKSDEGKVYQFPIFREDQSITVFFGPMIRKDLLDQANLAVPETIDEWYTALKAFKQMGVKTPFASLNWFVEYCDAFVGAFGTSATANIVPGKDGRMHYGPIEPGYKQFLETFRKWYAEGLIDPDYPTLLDWDVLTQKVVTGDAAATLHFLSNVSDYTTKGKELNPNFQMVATKYPVLNKGEVPLYGQKSSSILKGSSISAKCKNIERALQYFDWFYTEEAILLSNFGIEGESYTMVNGQPVYTKLITDEVNEKGWTQEQALDMYCPAAGDNVPGMQMTAYFNQIRLKNDLAREAVKLWSEPLLSSFTPGVSLTEAESKIAAKLADVETYVKEMTAKFILGDEPMESFDKYVERCKQLGIDDVLKVYNDAYERYQKR